MRRAVFGLSLFVSILVGRGVEAAPIYVITEKDGSIRFTSKKPAAGVQAEVFTAKGGTLSRTGRWRPKPLRPEAYTALVEAVASQVGIDRALILAVMHAESGFNPKAVSPKGAQGLMQLMPAVAKEMGVQSPFDPEQNIAGGARYLAILKERFSGDLRLTLAAYNAGPAAVDRYKGIPPYSETQEYVRRVVDLYSRYRRVVK